MKSGLLIYQKEDAKRNRWLIDELLSRAKDYDLALHLIDPVDDALTLFKVNKYDFVLNRSRDIFVADLLNTYSNEVVVINPPRVNALANNKFNTYRFLLSLGVPVVPSMMEKNKIRVFPKVMKSVDGHGGKDVYLVNNLEEINKVENENGDKIFIFQDYVKGANKDMRIYIKNGEIFASVLRENKDDFRSNFSLGGTATLVTEIPEKIREVCKKICNELHPDFIGVDFLLPNGLEGNFFVNEIEDPVGSRMLYSLLNVDVPDLLLSLIKEKFISK